MENRNTRKIIHIDMDAFYASIEQRDNPEYKGKPLMVGGTVRQRGVVAACSYEARKFGVHSAMATARAIALCPGIIVKPPRFDAYEHVSRQIHRIFRLFTDKIEPLSLDEAYLDVTLNKRKQNSATKIAVEIKSLIYKKTGLTASAGVSYNKFLAKCASDFNKPNGLTVITPAKAQDFTDRLPIGKFYGVGKVTEQLMKKNGIYNGKDLRNVSKANLTRLFGKQGEFFYCLARAQDDREVETEYIRKSTGREHTYPDDITDIHEILRQLKAISGEVYEQLKKDSDSAKTVTLKIKYHDFMQITRSKTLKKEIQDTETIFSTVHELLSKTDAGKKPLRMLGISLSGFPLDNTRGQLKLF